MSSPTSAFALPDRLGAKAAPTLIGEDEGHFATIAAHLELSVAALTVRRDEALKAAGGSGQAAMDRDTEIRRLGSELSLLRRYGLDLCLGRMVRDDSGETVYIGRLGLTDSTGDRLLIDWRSPAAEPFFGATHGTPMGLASRRRYRWTRGRVTDYWDEVFAPERLQDAAQRAALDDQSAFIAGLGGSRSARMRDVLGTLQADQDAVIRAGSTPALVIDGGPGTGKTVVALHRAAYLLYSDPRVSRRRGGVLFVGPSPAYLGYVGDVLPSLGEEGVQLCTLRDLVPEGAGARHEADPDVAALKASLTLVTAVERAVRFHEQPPVRAVSVETDWADVVLEPEDWADAFDAVEPGLTHNEARPQVWNGLLDLMLAKVGVEDAGARRSFAQNGELRAAFARAWPLLDPAGVVSDLLSNPGYLRLCAPDLSDSELASLQRSDARAWTTSDLPLLDAARHLIGDPAAAEVERRRTAARALQRERMARVVDDLIAADDSDLLLSTMLRGADAQNSLLDDADLPSLDPDLLAGPFAHVVVDEAQELTDAEWRMLIRRCPSRSFTIVGDRAQARRGFTETWEERLERVGLGRIERAGLTVNYRTPEEVMVEAEPVIRAALPDANVPTSVRRSGIPVAHRRCAERDAILADWLATHPDGIACVIGDPDFPPTERVRSLPPEEAKGLEFDLVVLVEPRHFGEGIQGAVDRYVAMTRATERLIVLEG